MTWQWVVLILGIVIIVALLCSYYIWATLKLKMFESIPRTIPDLFKSQRKDDTLVDAREQDTIVDHERQWPQAFTGSEHEPDPGKL